MEKFAFELKDAHAEYVNEALGISNERRQELDEVIYNLIRRAVKSNTADIWFSSMRACNTAEEQVYVIHRTADIAGMFHGASHPHCAKRMHDRIWEGNEPQEESSHIEDILKMVAGKLGGEVIHHQEMGNGGVIVIQRTPKGDGNPVPFGKGGEA